MNYLFILIHGTFSPKAEWTQENSILRRMLNDKINGNLHFDRFEWSGKNSHEERINASNAFLEKLIEYSNNSTYSKKIIISHSHGGNVALYSLRELGENAKDFDLITIGTPFLNASRRKFKKNINFIYFTIQILILSVLGVSIYGLYEAHNLSTTSVLKGIYILFGIILGIIFYFLFLSVADFKDQDGAWFIKRKLRKLEQNANVELKKIEFPKVHVNHLAIVDQGDEVRFWFGGLYKLWEIFFLIVDFLLLIGRIVYVPLTLLLFVILICGLKEWHIPKWVGVYSTYGVIFIGFISVAFAILLLLLTITKSNLIALGKETPIYQLLIRIEPSITPLNKKIELIQYNFRRSSTMNIVSYLSNKHAIYNRKKTILSICNWINERNAS